MNEIRPLRVFLCHASQDKVAVRELNQRLKRENWLDPWLDEEKISLGQHWTTVIEDALDAADIVIIFLSHNSVRKEGFVQRELNYAWEISLEKPHDVIFLIPFRLDDCEVPRYLRSKQWGDYFGEKKESTYSALMQSLKDRHNYIARLEEERRNKYEKQAKEQILLPPSKEPPKESIVDSSKKEKTLPDFRIRQREYLLATSLSINTQLLDLDKLLTTILQASMEMLAGQAAMVVFKQQEGWRVAASQGFPRAFLDHLSPLLEEKAVSKFDVDDLNRMLKELTYTASMGFLNGTGLPLSFRDHNIGVIFVVRNFQNLFTPNDRFLLQAFSNHAAIAIINAQLYNDVISKNDSLSQ